MENNNKTITNTFGEVINLRDGDFFKFEEKSEKIRNQYMSEHPNCDGQRDPGLEKVLSDLLIESVKISLTEKGNVSKNFFGHKINEIRDKKTKELEGISITLYGKYKDKTREYTGLSTFNNWYEKKIMDCQKLKLKDKGNKEVVKTSKNNGSVVFSLMGNDYCFEGLNGMRFVFNKNGDSGIKFKIEELVG